MKHLRDRNDIIEFLERSHDWGSVRIAMQDAANVEFLGFFTHVSTYGEPGWIVVIKSGTQTHLIAVYYQQRMLCTQNMWGEPGIPWEHWVGYEPGKLSGDNPERYKELRDEARQR